MWISRWRNVHHPWPLKRCKSKVYRGLETWLKWFNTCLASVMPWIQMTVPQKKKKSALRLHLTPVRIAIPENKQQMLQGKETLILCW
jgi:hypothetical protein